MIRDPRIIFGGGGGFWTPADQRSADYLLHYVSNAVNGELGKSIKLVSARNLERQVRMKSTDVIHIDHEVFSGRNEMIVCTRNEKFLQGGEGVGAI